VRRRCERGPSGSWVSGSGSGSGAAAEGSGSTGTAAAEDSWWSCWEAEAEVGSSGGGGDGSRGGSGIDMVANVEGRRVEGR
jgi:hypothetical protein